MTACAGTLRQHGFALVAVLWIVAALSLFASALAGSARIELRGVQVMQGELRAQMQGDAAIFLALQEIAASGQPVQRLVEYPLVFEGDAITVRVIPSGGLINLNLADKSLLTDALLVLAGLDQAHALQLAQNIVLWRDFDTGVDDGGTGQTYRHEPFRVIEDLLQVPGIGYDLFVILRPFVTVDPVGDGRVAPLAAPEEVLNVLAHGNPEVSRRISLLRDSGEPLIDTTMLDQRYTGSHVGNLLRLEARVTDTYKHTHLRIATARLLFMAGGRAEPQIVSVETLPVSE